MHAIDDQHHVLFQNIARLEQALATGQGGDGLPQIIRELAEYAGQHGPTEERLMEEYGYPLREIHTMEHEQFFVRLREIDRMVAEGHSTAAVQALNRLRAWLERHIMDWDARLGDFLNRRGVA